LNEKPDVAVNPEEMKEAGIALARGSRLPYCDFQVNSLNEKGLLPR
jgi:hypothetical protein